MIRYTVLTLGLALALPCAGLWAENPQGAGQGGDNGTAPAATAPADATGTARPDQAPPGQRQPDQVQPLPDQPKQPDQLQPNQLPPNQPQPVPERPNAPQPNAVEPNAAPANPAQPAAPPQPAPGNAIQAPGETAPAAPLPGGQNVAPGQEQPTPAPGAAAAADQSPLHAFVSDNVNEVGMLADQIQQAKAANRPEVVRMLQHMVRDHVLVADAARIALARSGQRSTPQASGMEMGPMGNSLEEMIRADIQAHEQMLTKVQQLRADASTPQERSIYQQALNATQRHLDWLRSFDQGRPVQLGYFGPTPSLTQIAALPVNVGTSRVAGFRSGGRSRYGRHRGMRRHYGTRRHRRSRYTQYRRGGYYR